MKKLNLFIVLLLLIVLITGCTSHDYCCKRMIEEFNMVRICTICSKFEYLALDSNNVIWQISFASAFKSDSTMIKKRLPFGEDVIP